MAELTRRYVVMTMASEVPFDPNDREGVFVLKPWKDPAALRALAVYRDNCYPELARDLDGWIGAIEAATHAGVVVRGGVGRRNEPFVKADSGTVASARPRPNGSASRGTRSVTTRKTRAAGKTRGPAKVRARRSPRRKSRAR